MTKDYKPASALPEKFEVFEQSMQEAEKPKRRRSTPAVKPKNLPETKTSKRPTAADVSGVGGMIEKRWSGIPMWACLRCNGTTFDEVESRVHKCKQVKYASDEELAD